MSRFYSRLAKMEEKKNIKTSIFFLTLTILLIIITFIFGIPTLIKFSGFLSNLAGSSKPPEKNDTTPPAPPHLSTLPDFTKEQSLAVTGTTEPGATVSLFINDQKDEVVANSEGQFSFLVSLSFDQNEIYATSTDQSSNQSAQSKKYVVFFNNKNPDLEILSPNDGETFAGPKKRQVEIKGTTEKDSQLTINDKIVVLDSEGKFSYFVSLSSGENSFILKSQDKAGNLTEKELKVTYLP